MKNEEYFWIFKPTKEKNHLKKLTLKNPILLKRNKTDFFLFYSQMLRWKMLGCENTEFWKKLAFLRPVAVFGQKSRLFVAEREIFLKREKIEFFISIKICPKKIPSKVFLSTKVSSTHSISITLMCCQNKPRSLFLKPSNSQKYSYLTSIFYLISWNDS